MSQNESHHIAANESYNEINKILSNIVDFTPFYIAITICTVILGLLLIINVVCCCSRYSGFWLNRHTGNRRILSIWSAPYRQPPVEYTVLESQFQYVQYEHPIINTKYSAFHRQVPASASRQPLTV